MSVPHVSLMQALNKIPIPGNPNPSTRWRWFTLGVAGFDGDKIKLQVWYVANRPFTTDAAVSEFMSACTQAQERKAQRRAARSADVNAAELKEVGL